MYNKVCPSSEPLCETILNNKGKIISRFGVFSNIKVYGSHCSSCQMKYRHQEWKDGFVNFDNNIFLSLDLCLYLRHSIEEHTAIGRVVGTLEKQYDVLLPKQKLIKGFFLFDSLSNHNFDFNCLLCGYYPMILTFDCTRNACFQENDWSMEDNCSESEVVDPVNFWKRITLYSIADGLSSGKANPFKVNVNTSNWSPWISTKNCNIVINTEGKKGENSDTAEGDPLDIISEERIEELLLSGTVSTLRALCSECGFPMPNGTKLACIAKLKSVLETNTSFNKTFFQNLESVWWYCACYMSTWSCLWFKVAS